MSYISLIVVLILMALGSGGYIWYLEKSTDSLKNINPVISPVSSSSKISTNSQEQNCQKFNQKFGTTAEELVKFVNDEPDSAIVLKGYLNIYTKITGLTPGAFEPIIFTLDGNGKIISFACTEPDKERNYSHDIDIVIPETDLAQIIRYRETLEASQASVYLQNATTKPVEAKEIIIARIQSLE